MPRRVKKNRSIFTPIAETFVNKLSSADRKFRQKLLRIVMIFLLVMFGYSLMSGTYGIPRIIKLELTKNSLEDSNRKLTAELLDAGRIRELLTSDSDYIEYIARTRFYMAKPNEIIYRFHGH